MMRRRSCADGAISSKRPADDISSVALLWTVPAVDGFPPELQGKRAFLYGALYAGSAEDGEKATAPLRAIGKPVLDLSGRGPYTTWQKAFDPFFVRGQVYPGNLRLLEVDLPGRAFRRGDRRSGPALQGRADRSVPDCAVASGWRDRPAGDGRHRLRPAQRALPAELRQLLDRPGSRARPSSNGRAIRSRRPNRILRAAAISTSRELVPIPMPSAKPTAQL